MTNKEFYWNTEKSELLCEDLSSHTVTRFSDLPRSFIIEGDKKVSEDYTEIYQKLCDWVGSEPGKEYGRFLQFCCCNFSTKDGRADIDENWNFVPEIVSCPIRPRCNRGICHPLLTSLLSEREKQIERLFVNHNETEIAEILFLSPATVHNHITKIYKKLGFKGDIASKQLVEHACRTNNVS